MMRINIFIQARMSSARFPGKMLAPLRGQPMIAHVIERCRAALGVDKIVVLTSAAPSDDPLALYVEKMGCLVFRGVLDPVFERFAAACAAHPCDYFVRVSGDSPLIEPALLSDMITHARGGAYDFLSNVRGRTFPKGQSVEIVRASAFLGVDQSRLTLEQQEHVMPYFYDRADTYHSFFMESPVNARHINCCVDTVEDLRAIESDLVQYCYDGKGRECSAA